MATKKRERTANYTEYERQVFIKIVKKYKLILDNVKTDNKTLQRKNRVWIQVETEFNSDIQVRSRTWLQLKR